MNNRDGESTPSPTLTIRKTPRRTWRHFLALALIAGTAIIIKLLESVLDQGDDFPGIADSLVVWLMVIACVFAVWLLIRDWLLSGNMTFLFDGDKKVFCFRDKHHILGQLPFNAIKRIKIEESSNTFPVYTLSVHLQDGQIIEIDASARQAEIGALADQIAEMTGAEILIQLYDEPLSKEEREDQAQRQREAGWKGD